MLCAIQVYMLPRLVVRHTSVREDVRFTNTVRIRRNQTCYVPPTRASMISCSVSSLRGLLKMKCCIERTEKWLRDPTESNALAAAAQCFLFVGEYEHEIKQMCDRAGISHEYDPRNATVGFHRHMIQLCRTEPLLCKELPGDVVNAMARLLRCRNGFKRRASYYPVKPIHPLAYAAYIAATQNALREMDSNLGALNLDECELEHGAPDIVAFTVDQDGVAKLGGTLFRLYVIYTEVNEHFGDHLATEGAAHMYKLRYVSQKWRDYSADPADAPFDKMKWPAKDREFMDKLLSACAASKSLNSILLRGDWGSTTSHPTATQQTKPSHWLKDVEYVKKGGDMGCLSDMNKVFRAFVMHYRAIGITP